MCAVLRNRNGRLKTLRSSITGPSAPTLTRAIWMAPTWACSIASFSPPSCIAANICTLNRPLVAFSSFLPRFSTATTVGYPAGCTSDALRMSFCCATAASPRPTSAMTAIAPASPRTPAFVLMSPSHFTQRLRDRRYVANASPFDYQHILCTKTSRKRLQLDLPGLLIQRVGWVERQRNPPSAPPLESPDGFAIAQPILPVLPSPAPGGPVLPTLRRREMTICKKS